MVDIKEIRDDIEACQNEIKALQHRTVECVSFAPTGKVTVTDKPRLEDLNSEVARLEELSTHNADVLARLTDPLGEYATIESIRARKHQLEEQILRAKNILRVDIGILIRDGYDVNPGDPFAHPKGKALKERADAALALVTPLLASATDLLTRAEVILAEFKPSGLEPQRAETRGIISGEKAGGMA